VTVVVASIGEILGTGRTFEGTFSGVDSFVSLEK
jgi:hypothetical protein